MAEAGRETIAAVVVTYNRKALLGQCLEALRRQSHPPDAILVIDNCSTDGTYDDLLGKHLIAPVSTSHRAPSESVRTAALLTRPDRTVEIHYVRMPENTGGAGGFHEGMGRGVDAGFDWLWLMDDDLLPTPEALEALVARKEALALSQDRAFLLNSLVLAKEPMDDETLAFPLQELTERGQPKLGVYHWRLSEVRDQIEDGLYRWACPFNGTFIPSSAIAEIGLPNKDFYIRGDEKDFLWRAARKLDFYTVVDSKVYHPIPEDSVFDWKQYYSVRNMLVVNRHFRFTTLRNLKLVAKSLMIGLGHGRAGLVLTLRAVRDGLTGRLGKREDLLP